jgi:hypothetical protein
VLDLGPADVFLLWLLGISIVSLSPLVPSANIILGVLLVSILVTTLEPV